MWQHASSNRAYRLVWNRAKGIWAVAPETAKGQGKASTSGGTVARIACACASRRLPWRLAILAGLGLLARPSLSFALDANALPGGGQVGAGQAQITVHGNQLTVNQSSRRAVIDWQRFDVGRDAAVRFNQPGADAATLNRVTGGSRSEILGKMDANGQVYLVNGAGVLFGQSAQVNVGGLVASTLNITDQDFLAGKDRFTLTDKSTGEVVNQGRINATGGTVALLGATVRNEGIITAAGGNAILAAGKEISFAAGANGHLHLAVEASALQLAVRNGGAIQAEGGQIVLNAQGADALAAAVVSNTGSLQAQTVAQREGKILLLADLDHGGTTQVAGSLDARAPTVGNGGFIETSGTHVKVADGVQITTRAAQGHAGIWLIDPADFIVAASGGDITGATLSSNLGNGNVVLQSNNGGVQTNGNGDIFVRDNVAWSGDTTLTLEAQRNIYIDAPITATGQNAGLKLNYGDTRGDINAPAAAGSDYHVRAPVTLSGTNASFAVNGQQYTLIHSLAQLDALDGNVSDTGPVNSVSGYFALATSLDGGGTTYGHSLVGGGAVPFQGTFAGLGNVIRNLTISRGGFASNWSALFAATSASAYIRDLGVVGGGSVSGNLYSGGLVGENKGRIHNSFSTLNVSANNSGGGLVGNNEGTISNSYAQGTVNGTAVLGGLAGSNRGTISNSYSLGNVSGANDSKGYSIGGLIGINGGTVSNAYSLGAATGTDAGGSVGKNSSPTLRFPQL